MNVRVARAPGPSREINIHTNVSFLFQRYFRQVYISFCKTIDLLLSACLFACSEGVKITENEIKMPGEF